MAAALAWNTSGKLLAMVSYNLYEFVTTPAPAAPTAATDESPERLPGDAQEPGSPEDGP